MWGKVPVNGRRSSVFHNPSTVLVSGHKQVAKAGSAFRELTV